jgi:hypothetical protein
MAKGEITKQTDEGEPKKPKATVRGKKKAGLKAEPFNLHQHLANLQLQMGIFHSPEGKKPGDVAWRGPCEGKTQMVCRFDNDMQPSNCGPEKCLVGPQ